MSSIHRIVTACALSLCAFVAVAQNQRPANLQPLPDVPPPPPGVAADADLEPQVTIVRRGEDKVEEYRVNGRLYMMKVTPTTGPSYYLVDEEGKGSWARRDNFDTNFQPPRWVIFSW